MPQSYNRDDLVTLLPAPLWEEVEHLRDLPKRLEGLCTLTQARSLQAAIVGAIIQHALMFFEINDLAHARLLTALVEETEEYTNKSLAGIGDGADR